MALLKTNSRGGYGRDGERDGGERYGR